MVDQRDEAVRKRAYCAWPIHDYSVCPVKYLKALLDEAVTMMIQDTAAEIAERFPIEPEAMGLDPHHRHLLCRAHPNVVPGRSVQMFKRLTARGIVRRKPEGKWVLWGGEWWSDGDEVATGGERANWQTVERSVQRPGQPRTDLR